MHFRIKHIVLFISILGINLILGQGYFSTFFPVNNFSMDARAMAMGGSDFGSMENLWAIHKVQKLRLNSKLTHS